MLKRIAPVMGAAILAFGALYGCGESPSAPQTTGAAVDQLAKVTAPTHVNPTLNDDVRSLFALKPYERYLKELKLTPEQAPKARRCLEQYANCIRETHAAFSKAQREINAKYESGVREVKHLVEIGRLTAQQGRERIAALKERANAALREALEIAKKGVAQCERNFERCIREFLTREQIAKWERLTAKK